MGQTCNLNPRCVELIQAALDDIEPRLRGLMLSGLAGEAAPYRQLLEELGGRLRAYYGRRVPPGLDAEDLVQETLIAVHTRRATYDPGQPFTAWAYAIARYKLIDALRRARLHLKAPLDDADDLFVAPGADAAMAGRDLERMLGRLTPRTQALIRDVKIAGLSTREAAEKHGMSESAVKVAVHRGLRALGAEYAPTGSKGDVDED